MASLPKLDVKAEVDTTKVELQLQAVSKFLDRLSNALEILSDNLKDIREADMQ